MNESLRFIGTNSVCSTRRTRQSDFLGNWKHFARFRRSPQPSFHPSLRGPSLWPSLQTYMSEQAFLILLRKWHTLQKRGWSSFVTRCLYMWSLIMFFEFISSPPFLSQCNHWYTLPLEYIFLSIYEITSDELVKDLPFSCFKRQSLSLKPPVFLLRAPNFSVSNRL